MHKTVPSHTWGSTWAHNNKCVGAKELENHKQVNIYECTTLLNCTFNFYFICIFFLVLWVGCVYRSRFDVVVVCPQAVSHWEDQYHITSQATDSESGTTSVPQTLYKSAHSPGLTWTSPVHLYLHQTTSKLQSTGCTPSCNVDVTPMTLQPSISPVVPVSWPWVITSQ